ncbi:protein EMSY-LIKE 1 isoform X2 [Citrus clementina]|uniref:protein EMSY-LIKE 1 isoform X2 n=1 Tax=Citrus clementina TaxID=85681 RepID=UPI000CED569D|nr:protein EMSY-LIKE 1 isoform X2 [Citrus x clementina]
MEYEVGDSSGTDDDLPSHQSRVPRSSRFAVNGRSDIGSAPYSRMHTDMEAQIHQLEQEAYCAVLRAFKAQADAITWEKEGLITELRKELRVSDDEHRELLTKVHGDELIKRIRDWRQAGGNQAARLANSQPVHDLLPSPSVSASRKRHKATQSGQSFHSLPLMNPVQYPPTGPAANRSFINRSSSGNIPTNEPAEAATFDPLIGRKVWTRWPEDNNFYEAVITDYNPTEISHEDIRWESEDPGITYRGGFSGQGRGIKRPFGRGGHIPGSMKGRGSSKDQSQLRKEFTQTQNRLEKVSGDIELLNTETLVKEVERLFDVSHPDPLELVKAKKMLKEHEQALIDAISRLADASDGESDGEQPEQPVLQGQLMDHD